MVSPSTTRTTSTYKAPGSAKVMPDKTPGQARQRGGLCAGGGRYLQEAEDRFPG